jgi:hypothetical protein
MFFPRNLKKIIFLHFQSHFLVEDFPSTKFQKNTLLLSWSKIFLFQDIEKAHSFFFSSLEKENHTSRDGKCFFNTLEKKYLTPRFLEILWKENLQTKNVIENVEKLFF